MYLTACTWSLQLGVMDEEKIRLREEVNEQLRALKELKEMAASYGFDVSKPATNSREAVQWVYFAYLVSAEHLCLNNHWEVNCVAVLADCYF